MFIDIVLNRNSSLTVLLRESYRNNKKVKKKILVNLSYLDQQVTLPAELNIADANENKLYMTMD